MVKRVTLAGTVDMVLARPKESKDWVRDLNVFPKMRVETKFTGSEISIPPHSEIQG